jgi:hypothetical protein
LMGALTNIDREGFGACAFHSYPDMMRFDAYSGDYGMSFFGHAFASATYLIRHPDFGWVAFGGAIDEGPSGLRLIPRDSARTRLFFGPEKLWLVLEAGRLAEVDFSHGGDEIQLLLEPGERHTPFARLTIEGPYRPAQAPPRERGAYAIRLGAETTRVRLVRT